MTLGPGIEPGPHWWEASALTTAPPLLTRGGAVPQQVQVQSPITNTSLLRTPYFYRQALTSWRITFTYNKNRAYNVSILRACILDAQRKDNSDTNNTRTCHQQETLVRHLPTWGAKQSNVVRPTVCLMFANNVSKLRPGLNPGITDSIYYGDVHTT